MKSVYIVAHYFDFSGAELKVLDETYVSLDEAVEKINKYAQLKYMSGAVFNVYELTQSGSALVYTWHGLPIKS